MSGEHVSEFIPEVLNWLYTCTLQNSAAFTGLVHSQSLQNFKQDTDVAAMQSGI